MNRTRPVSLIGLPRSNACRSACWLVCSLLQLALLPIPATAHSQTARISTRLAECRNVDPAGTCAFEATGIQFDLTGKGRFIRRGANSEARIHFLENGEVERVGYAEIESDLIVVYQIDSGENGGGGVFRIDARRMKLKWSVGVPAFNLSVGVLEGDRLYIGGIGFISAIDLTKGRFAWKHTRLYDREREAFTSFERPEVLDREVRFTEHIVSGPPRTPETIRVDKTTGRILK